MCIFRIKIDTVYNKRGTNPLTNNCELLKSMVIIRYGNYKIGSCDALYVEMWDMYIGMDMARRQGITHLQVENDSSLLVDMVIRKCNINENVPTLIQRIRD